MPACAFLASISLFILFAAAAFSLFACSVKRNALRVSCREKKNGIKKSLDTTPLVMHPVTFVRQMLAGRPARKERDFPNPTGEKIHKKV